MNENKSSNARSLLIGLAAGGAAGSILALLFAPKSGKELRRDIVLKKDKIINNTGRRVKKARKQVMEIYSNGMKKTEAILEETKSKLTSIRQSTGDAVNSGRELVKEAVKSGIEAYKYERKSHQH